MRYRAAAVVCVIPMLGLAACQSTRQFLASMQPQAIATAEARGQADLSCPSAKGTVLGERDVSPVVGLNLPSRAEFDIRVEGCETRATYVVACPDDGSGKCLVVDRRK